MYTCIVCTYVSHLMCFHVGYSGVDFGLSAGKLVKKTKAKIENEQRLEEMVFTHSPTLLPVNKDYTLICTHIYIMWLYV